MDLFQFFPSFVGVPCCKCLRASSTALVSDVIRISATLTRHN